MLELSNIITHILDETEKQILISFRDGERVTTFIGECEDIIMENSLKLIKLGGFGVYADVVHSIETSEMYNKLNYTSMMLKEIIPTINDEYFNRYTTDISKCNNKKDYGFKTSFMPDSNILFSFCLGDSQYALAGKMEYTIEIDENCILSANIDNTLPFLSNILDDIYIDFTSNLNESEALNVVKLITEGLIKTYNFKLIDSYNI